MKRILIAEDRPSSRELIRAVLESAGYEVLEAGDGEEALDIYEQEAPDLATPFLLAIGRTLTSRIRVANKHHGEAVQFARAME